VQGSVVRPERAFAGARGERRTGRKAAVWRYQNADSPTLRQTTALSSITLRSYLRPSLAFNMRDGVAAAISRPTLVCDAEGDLFFKGQPQELYDHLTCPKTMIVFTEAEGAGAHWSGWREPLGIRSHLRLA
jgi:hypothetical protein